MNSGRMSMYVCLCIDKHVHKPTGTKILNLHLKQALFKNQKQLDKEHAEIKKQTEAQAKKLKELLG